MDLIKNILAPTDLSLLSAQGVVYAGNLAKATGAQIIVGHVVPTDEFVSHARLLETSYSSAKIEEQLSRLLERHTQLLHDFVTRQLLSSNSALAVRQIVEMGDPYGLIVEWVKKNRIDLIIMSTHGRSGLPRMMLGSVTERVLRNAHCPVLAIPAIEK
jgi:nucleotide-binding universal stress UspA family protein